MPILTFDGPVEYLKRVVDAVLALDTVETIVVDKPKAKPKPPKAPEPVAEVEPAKETKPEPVAEKPAPMDFGAFKSALLDHCNSHAKGLQTRSVEVTALYGKFHEGAKKASDIPEDRRADFLASLAA